MRLEVELSKLNETELKQVFKLGSESRILGNVEILEIFYLPYWFVKVELPELIKEFKLTEIIKKAIAYSSLEVDLKTVETTEQMKVVTYLVNAYNMILKLEKAKLSSTPDPLGIAAGVNEFAQFGEIVTIDILANGNILEYDKIKKMPYSVVFEKLYLDKVRGEYQNRLTKLHQEKSKNERK